METAYFCQGCLSTENLLAYPKSDNKYESMFKICFNIKVGFGSDKLKWICQECINNLNKALDFKNLVEKTQNYLEECFSGTLQFCAKKPKLAKNLETKKIRYKLTNTFGIRKQKADCDLCSQPFVDEYSLTVHKHNSHGVKANVPKFAVMLACSFCNTLFAQLNDMNEHLVVGHDSFKEQVSQDTLNFFSCRICGFYFRDHSVRSYHLSTKHKLKELPTEMQKHCTDCDKTFKNVYSQAVHIFNAHKKRVKLPDGGVYLNCVHCKLDFRKIFTYKRHMKEFHRDSESISAKILWCKFCGCYFANKPDWLKHYQTHGVTSRKPKEASFKCKSCPQRFQLISTRKKHMVNAHNLKETLPCEVCGQLLSSKLALNKHLKIHSNEISAICDYCGYGVRDKFDLIAHFPKHSDKKQFKCLICMKEFKIYGTLRQHKKIHLEKQFCCSSCGQRFTHRANMKSHMIRNHKETCITDFSFNTK